MKNINITLMFITAILTVGLLGGWAYAETADSYSCNKSLGRMEMKHDKRMKVMAEVLDMSDTQRQQIRDIVEKGRTEMEPTRQKLCVGRDEMRALLESDSFDEDAIRALAQSQAELKTELFIARAKAKNQIFQLLTSGQQDLSNKLKLLLHKTGKHHRPMPEI